MAPQKIAEKDIQSILVAFENGHLTLAESLKQIIHIQQSIHQVFVKNLNDFGDAFSWAQREDMSFASCDDLDDLIQKYRARSEAEYLAQQNCSCSKGKGLDSDEDGNLYCIDCGKNIAETNNPINDYHAALEAIGQGRIKDIPQHLFDAILKELVDEHKRRWALQNGFVDQ